MVPVLVAALSLQASAAEPVVLALSPELDGRLVEEEWLPFGEGFLQWEPGKIHFAATLSGGRDLVLSLDPAADGWLNGNENREIRVSLVDGRTQVSSRLLVTSGRAGPTWEDVGSSTVKSVAAQSGGSWTVEGTVSLGRTVREAKTMGLMLSSVAKGDETGAPFLPRALTYSRFGFDSAIGLPEGVTWRSDARLREAAREDGLKMEFELRGSGSFSTAVVRAEGLARKDLAVVSRPVPAFGSRGSSNFEYESKIAAGAIPGWRILQARMGDTVLRTSFKVSSLVEIDVDLPESVEHSLTDRSIKGRVDVRSTGLGRIDGQYTLTVDPAWQVRRGGPQSVGIYNARGRERINLDFWVPGGSQGEFPVTFTVIVGSQVFERTVLIEVLPPGVQRPGS